MLVLVTGGTGVVGRATVTALVQRGHVVRLLSRDAEKDAAQWSNGVHAFPADITKASTLVGAASECDAVLHLASSIEERDRNALMQLNVEGTRNLIREMQSAGVRRFVYVSSLGADEGTSDYHRSKRAAEDHVRQFAGDWLIVRPGNVYGPGDEQISRLLRMVRTLPAVPAVGTGDQEFQPIWHEDLAEALAIAVERVELARRVLDLAGPETTTQRDLVQRMSRITNRSVAVVKTPELLTGIAVKVASFLGIRTPFNESQLTMLKDGNVIGAGSENALELTFGVKATPLDVGLQKLADAQDELLPREGVGPLHRKRYWSEFRLRGVTPETLMTHVRDNFARLMASFIDSTAESALPLIEEDATLTLSLPVRGHVQVRVEECEARVLTLVSLEGHPLAGAVRFLSEQRGDALRFEVQVFDRAANVGDLVLMRTIGGPVQDIAWRRMVQNVASSVGAGSPEVHEEAESLDRDQADRIDEWLAELVVERRRDRAGI